MKIKIDKKAIETPVKIVIGGKDYPITQWNIEVVRKYWDTGKEEVLEDLKDFSLVF